MTEQIIIDVTGGKVAVIQLNNGIPVPPTKNLSLTDNTLTEQEKAKVQAVITLINEKAK